MTTIRPRTVRTLPRPLIRTAWVLHRALNRFSRGHFGLSQPEQGTRFGMMRLATVGRRTGRPRVAIVGYFEDDEDLVTVAMNGWGEGDPAWWLNLQASPDAVVGLGSGPRSVRARVAEGAERERLWARLREFPGWGEDIDALAARRPTETAVVVLAPRSDTDEATEPRDGADRGQEQRSDGPRATAQAPSSGDQRRRPSAGEEPS